MQSRRDFLAGSGSFLAGLFIGGCLSTDKKLTKNKYPNILLITADDLGQQVGCYGDRQAKTPNIDKLAQSGVKFETAWVTQASCSPSRGSMYTGLYPHQNGLIGLCHRGYSMNGNYRTIPSMLKSKGYKTAVVGKFHIEPKSLCEWDTKFTDIDVSHHQRDVKTMNDFALDFMTDSDKPFFLMVNYIDPHRPFYDQKKGLPRKPLTKDDVETLPFLKVDSPEVRQEVAGYYNCVNRLDTGIGILMENLQKSGKTKDTIVIFVGDHGPPFTRSKTTCYDMALSVPFIVSFPGYIKGKQARKEMVSAIDIMPTILNLVGEQKDKTLPGLSLMPILKDNNVKWRNYLFGEYNAHQQYSWYPRRTIRSKRYHLIENLLPERQNPIKGVDGCSAWKTSHQKRYKDTIVDRAYDRYSKPPRYELYDLQNDPYELKNLAEKPEFENIKAELLSALNKWRQSTNDPLLDIDVLKTYTKRHDQARKLKSRAMPEGFLDGLKGL